MSVVWLVLYQGMECAAKTPKPNVSAKNKQLMFDAARLQQSVRHPNVLGVIAVFEDAEWPCILLELAPCGHVREFSKGSPSLKDKWNMALGVAKGTQALHQSSIVHRDLKGENIFLDENMVPKLADFDFAVQLTGSCKLRGSCGTPGFTAPEVLSNHEYDHSADVYSLGSVLYELMQSSFPFEKEVDFNRNDLHHGDWIRICDMLTLEGIRPALDQTCPKPMRDLVRNCWSARAHERPTIDRVVIEIEAMREAFF
uniref:Protein kinase domain-containing protein n=1 Tax=Eutreptiella gymnastica TaxID=73025 RepID=A0A7S1J7Z2_9EUGL